MYVADNYNHRIRKVTVSTGIITTIAGNGDTGYSGDNVAATSATVYYACGVAVDSSGSITICCTVYLQENFQILFLDNHIFIFSCPI